jgi:hypothetical protein
MCKTSGEAVFELLYYSTNTEYISVLYCRLASIFSQIMGSVTGYSLGLRTVVPCSGTVSDPSLHFVLVC